MPIPPGKGASSTPRRAAGRESAKVALAATASSCARSPCPSPPSAHRRTAGSCARDSRLTHHPRRPDPRHRIRRREHVSLSMSPVRGGGSWCPLSRALGVGSRAALAVAGARQLPAVLSRRRDGVAREQGRLVVAVARAERGWGCGLLLLAWDGRGAAHHQGGRAACSARPRRPRAAAIAAARCRGRR